MHVGVYENVHTCQINEQLVKVYTYIYMYKICIHIYVYKHTLMYFSIYRTFDIV